jgi:hypothetical protein
MQHAHRHLLTLALILAVGFVATIGAIGISSKLSVAPTVGNKASAGSCTNEFVVSNATPSPVGNACRATGCSGTVCADHTITTTCAYQASFACYQTATCARQANGQCGWTPTSQLTACLAGNETNTAVPNGDINGLIRRATPTPAATAVPRRNFGYGGR